MVPAILPSGCRPSLVRVVKTGELLDLTLKKTCKCGRRTLADRARMAKAAKAKAKGAAKAEAKGAAKAEAKARGKCGCAFYWHVKVPASVSGAARSADVIYSRILAWALVPTLLAPAPLDYLALIVHHRRKTRDWPSPEQSRGRGPLVKDDRQAADLVWSRPGKAHADLE